MSACVFPGSFDPPTRGHLDLIRRAASIMDHVTVCVMVNISKTGSIPSDERARMLEKACRGIPNVTVDRWDGLDNVSSSTVREIAAFGGDYSFLIPPKISKDIDRYLKK